MAEDKNSKGSKDVAAVVLLTIGMLGMRTGMAAHYALADQPAAAKAEENNPDKTTAADAKPEKPRLDQDSKPLPPGALARFQLGVPVNSLANAPDGKTLATGSFGDSLLRLWDVNTGKLICTRALPKRDAVTFVAFAPNGKTLVSAGYDGTVLVWDLSALRNNLR